MTGHDGQTVSCAPSGHEGFGCPGCGHDLLSLFEGADGGIAVVATRGTPCCGYFPSNDECRRWVRAAVLLRDAPE